jgi:hypothetical protein
MNKSLKIYWFLLIIASHTLNAMYVNHYEIINYTQIQNAYKGFSIKELNPQDYGRTDLYTLANKIFTEILKILPHEERNAHQVKLDLVYHNTEKKGTRLYAGWFGIIISWLPNDMISEKIDSLCSNINNNLNEVFNKKLNLLIEDNISYNQVSSKRRKLN